MRRLLRSTLWLVIRVVSSVVNEPYEVVVPYSTCIVAPSLVFHWIVAPEEVIPVAVMFESVGAVVSVDVPVPLPAQTPTESPWFK